MIFQERKHIGNENVSTVCGTLMCRQTLTQLSYEHKVFKFLSPALFEKLCCLKGSEWHFPARANLLVGVLIMHSFRSDWRLRPMHTVYRGRRGKGIWQWLWLFALGGKFEHQDSQERLQPPDTESGSSKN